MDADVIVVGAGLAGLVATHELTTGVPKSILTRRLFARINHRRLQGLVSFKCPIGHRVDIPFENWTRDLRT
jgi:predicted oxidoreductase